MQVPPSLRIRPRKSSLFTGAWRTTQTRPFHATSLLYTLCHDMSLLCAQIEPSNSVFWMVGTRLDAHCHMGHTCSVVVFLSQRRCTDGSYVRYGLGADSCPRLCDKCMPFQQLSAHSSWVWVSFRPHREMAFSERNLVL